MLRRTGPRADTLVGMNTRTAPVAALAVVVATCASCAFAGHSDEAYRLSDELSALPGVERADVYYVDPRLFHSAEVSLHVRMRDNATPEQVAAVFVTGYEALTDVHLGEEGNLFVRVRDDRLRLRTFESEADTADVEEATLVAATVAEQQYRTTIDVLTSDVDAAPYVESTVAVRLPKGSSDTRIEWARAAVEDAYGDLPATVDVKVALR